MAFLSSELEFNDNVVPSIIELAIKISIYYKLTLLESQRIKLILGTQWRWFISEIQEKFNLQNSLPLAFGVTFQFSSSVHLGNLHLSSKPR